jgi:hypothetical protein
MKRFLLSIFLVISSNGVLAQFSGDLVLEPAGCVVTRECHIKNALHFVGADGLEWEAMAGLETDGATIPSWAQPFIGSPYDESYIKAAVVHDHYCDRNVRSWRETHRAFYYMLRSLNVPELKSKIMYYAVFIGGPKWIDLIPGNDCGNNCINKFNQLAASEKVISQPESYSSIDDLDERLQSLEQTLMQDNLSLEEIEDLAISESPDNFYFNNGGTYLYDPAQGPPL